MRATELKNRLDCFPIIAAIRDNRWKQALNSPAEILFYLEANILTVRDRIRQAHAAEKIVFVHLDLAEGIGRDKTGIRYLADCGVDGILSTKAQLIRWAKEQNLLTIQRFFVLDSHSMNSITEMVHSTEPHLMEIMPGVICKALKRFGEGSVPVIAGGLLENKSEVTTALSCGATAVSTSREELWYL